MNRSFTDRLLGGVCGGLAQAIPLPINLWRGLFIVAALIAPPAALTAYLLFWWLLPLQSPIQSRKNQFGAVFAVVLTIALFVGWFARDGLRSPNGGDVYLPLVLVLLAGVFLYKQISGGIRHNVLLALVILLTMLVVLGSTWGIIPYGIYDFLLRGAPALLIFWGATLLLRFRVPYGGVVGLVVALALTGVLASIAYSSRVDLVLDQNQVTTTQEVGAGVTTLQVNIEALETEVRFSAAPVGTRTITAQFSGSNESVLVPLYTEEDNGIATFTLRETRPNPYPLLEAIGRGTLNVALPPDISMAIAFAGVDGDATFDLGELRLELLNIEVQRGNALVTLPAYDPLSPSMDDNPGVWTVRGDLRVVLPQVVGARFIIPPNSNPVYDEALYRIEIAGGDWLMVARNYEESSIKIAYRLQVRGQTRIDVQN